MDTRIRRVVALAHFAGGCFAPRAGRCGRLAFKTFNDVVAAAKKKSGKLTISTSGVGSIWHEVGATVADAAGIELRFVPYKGGKPATVAGLQGEVDIAGGGVHEHVEFLRAGKLRNLMHTGPKDLDIPGYGKALNIANYIPALKALWRWAGCTGIAERESRRRLTRSTVWTGPRVRGSENRHRKIPDAYAWGRRIAGAPLECLALRSCSSCRRHRKKVRRTQELGSHRGFRRLVARRGYSSHMS